MSPKAHVGFLVVAALAAGATGAGRGEDSHSDGAEAVYFDFECYYDGGGCRQRVAIATPRRNADPLVFVIVPMHAPIPAAARGPSERDFCMACTPGVLSRVGDYSQTVVGTLAGNEVVKVVYNSSRVGLAGLLDSYFSHPLNDHMASGATVWTSSESQAGQARDWLGRHPAITGTHVVPFSPAAGDWQ
eukprot:gene6937-6602_t